MNDTYENIEKSDVLYEGKAKIIYKTNHFGLLIQYFKDDTTAFNKVKFEIIEGKGVLNNSISSIIMEKLANIVPTHFIRKINEREQLVMAASVIPLEVVVRNVSAGSFAKNFGIAYGKPILPPLVEFFYKKDELGDPTISPNQIICLGLTGRDAISKMEGYALKINSFLKELFLKAGIVLVDFKVEFGYLDSGELVLADEISPDSCRLWDVETNKSLDKDLFRKGLGDIVPAYAEVLHRILAV